MEVRHGAAVPVHAPHMLGGVVAAAVGALAQQALVNARAVARRFVHMQTIVRLKARRAEVALEQAT